MKFKVKHFAENSITSDAGKRRECRVYLQYEKPCGMVSELDLNCTPQLFDTLRVGDLLELVNRSNEARSETLINSGIVLPLDATLQMPGLPKICDGT